MNEPQTYITANGRPVPLTDLLGLENNMLLTTAITSSRHADIHMQCLNNPLHRVPFRLRLPGQGLVEAFPVQARICGKLGNAFVLGGVSQGRHKHSRVIVHEGLGQILTHIGFVQQMVKRVIRFGFGFHGLASQVFSQFLGGFNVALLGRLVAAAQQNNDFLASDGEVNTVASTYEKPHFAHAIAKAFNVAKIAVGGPIQAHRNSLCDRAALDAGSPFVKSGCGLDFVVHGAIVAYEPQKSSVDNACLRGYAYPVAHIGGTGLASWNRSGAAATFCGFFVPKISQSYYVGLDGAPARVAGRFSGKANFVQSGSMISLLGSGLKPLPREAIMNTPTTSELNPELAIINGEIKTNSLKIAEHFGKRHDTVLRSIKNLDCSDDFRRRNFAETLEERENPKGGLPIKSPAYELTRDGFTFLAMGFTGKQAAQWKEAYILAFNCMESELHENPSKPTPVPKALPKAKPERRYNYPRRLLEQPHFSTHTQPADLSVSMLGNTTEFVSPLFALLNELRADGHDVSAPWDEAVAMREAIQRYNKVMEEVALLMLRKRFEPASTSVNGI